MPVDARLDSGRACADGVVPDVLAGAGVQGVEPGTGSKVCSGRVSGRAARVLVRNAGPDGAKGNYAPAVRRVASTVSVDGLDRVRSGSTWCDGVQAGEVRRGALGAGGHGAREVPLSWRARRLGGAIPPSRLGGRGPEEECRGLAGGFARVPGDAVGAGVARRLVNGVDVEPGEGGDRGLAGDEFGAKAGEGAAGGDLGAEGGGAEALAERGEGHASGLGDAFHG